MKINMQVGSTYMPKSTGKLALIAPKMSGSSWTVPQGKESIWNVTQRGRGGYDDSTLGNIGGDHFGLQKYGSIKFVYFFLFTA